MADRNRRRPWEGLDHNLLIFIFMKMNVSADELIRTVPLVCRGWREAVARPECWSEIDIVKWSRRAPHADVINVAVRNLVNLTCHNLQRLSAFRMGNCAFKITASFGNHLRVLEIPMCKVNDSALENFSRYLTALAVLDISGCYKITSKGIEALGKNCMSLIHLRRNMYPLASSIIDRGVNEREALAVANTMSGLEHLELEFGRFSDRGLDAILSNCKALSSLNIGGCIYVGLAGDVGTRCRALKFFTIN